MAALTAGQLAKELALAPPDAEVRIEMTGEYVQGGEIECPVTEYQGLRARPWSEQMVVVLESYNYEDESGVCVPPPADPHNAGDGARPVPQDNQAAVAALLMSLRSANMAVSNRDFAAASDHAHMATLQAGNLASQRRTALLPDDEFGQALVDAAQARIDGDEARVLAGLITALNIVGRKAV